MDIRLLGPVGCWRADRPVALHGRSARAMLAMLALERGHVLSTDQLVDGLWSQGLPVDPSAAVYVTVSRVRVALGGDRGRLRTAGHGYVLDADDDEIDVGRAEAALARGCSLLHQDQAAAAMAVLAAALAEWRHDTPMEELADLPFASAAVSRLEQLRCELVEAANRACLESGAPHEVIDRSERALRLDPWRENVVAQLMTALYQSGRQGDALAVYARLASSLEADFGADPTPELKQLRARMVGHAPVSGHQAAINGLAVESWPVWFKTALEDLDAAERHPRLRYRLMLALGQAEHQAGLATWRQTLLRAADLAAALDDPSIEPPSPTVTTTPRPRL